MKKNLLLLFLILSFTVTGCSKNSMALEFKKEYESINGQETKSGAIHRSVKIPDNNPYEKVTTSEILKKIENKETFYVYFGDKLCPWCRSVIEKSIEVASVDKINKIYYVKIWDDDGNEVIRDKVEIVDGKLEKTIEGTKDYQKLLEIFDDLLRDYTISDEAGNKISTGEKRIYAPNYIYIEKGTPKKLITGKSEKQTNSREELTIEMLEDEEKQFKEFFAN